MSAEEATPAVETPVVVGRLNGRVKWFRNNLGYGFITVVSPGAPENGRDVFVHQSNVHPAVSTYRTLIKDEYVSLDLSDEEIIDRMMIPMINEVVLCLQEGIIASPQEADMALVYGLGFPPFRGGVFRYLDSVGIAEFVAMAEQHQGLGAMYQVPQMLIDMAAKGETFYGTQQHGSI